jgi:putative oxidoreductase
MIVAALTVHLRNGYFATNNGYELPTMNVAAALALAFAGPGLYSLDAAFGIDGVWTDPLRWSIVLIAVVLGIITPLARRASQAQPAA